jgi:hypothetical protein
VVETVDHRYGRRGGRDPGAGLVAKQLQMLHVRPDEGEACLGAHPRKITVLGEEPVARVEGVAAGHSRRRDHGPGIQIGGRTLTRQSPDVVGHAEVQAVGVVFRIHGNGGQTHVGRSAGDADGDLAPVGDQQSRHAHGVVRFIREGRSPRRWSPDDALVSQGGHGLRTHGE